MVQVISTRNDFDEIANNAWSGAITVCKEIYRQHRSSEAMAIIEDYFEGEYLTETALNDFVWFELADIMNLYGDNKEDAEVED